MGALPVPSPDPKMCERLAALADGELSPIEASVARAWLDEHPEFADDFRTQQEFGPRGERIELARHPLPAPPAWSAALSAIAAGIAPVRAARPERRFLAPKRLLFVAASGIAACVALLVGAMLTGPANGPSGRISVLNPFDDDEAIVLALNDDIEFQSLPEDAHAYLPVGRHPLSDGIVLANATEVVHHSSEPIRGGSPARLDLPDEASEIPLIWIPPHQP